MQEELWGPLVAMVLWKLLSCQVLSCQFYMKCGHSRIFSEVHYSTDYSRSLTFRGETMFLTHKFSAFLPHLSGGVQTTEILNEIVVI